MGNINLEILNDLQKTWLTQLAYVNINDEGRQRIAEGGLLISELPSYMEDPEKFFAGNAGLNDNAAEKVSDRVLGEKQFESKLDIVQTLIQCGLGNLRITNISEKQTLLTSGFQAMTFADSYGNTGISFRGSDLEFSQGGIRDWVEADMLEYFRGTSKQKEEALAYFEANKNTNGNNFLYGHSLGGNLTSHTLAEKPDEIKQAFTINGNPINQKLLDTPEKREAFNDPEKYQCNVVCGDVVGHLKSCEAYKDNVNYIRNNHTMNNSFVSAHLVGSASYDENGNFVKASEEEMKEEMGTFKGVIMNFIQNVREILNKVGDKFDKDESKKSSFSEYTQSVEEHFQTIMERFRDKDNVNDNPNINEFHNVSAQAEQEFISNITEYLNQKKYLEINTTGRMSK